MRGYLLLFGQTIRTFEYIRAAKRLNSRQARWALFFGRFDFSISYCPGSKNIKPNALSRVFDRSERPSSPEFIIPQKIVGSMVTWEIESRVRTALQGVMPPPGCPPCRLFVPEILRSDIIRWGHCSKVACHPGVSRTMFLIKQRFWWQSMARDICLFVLACSVCATSKTSNRPPAGLLQPLSVPSRPWSHISLDFVKGLPPSQGNTAVLTVVDRFSKATHFIPLPKLPSARQTAVAVIDHVFRIHGLPTDVVSDRGPQFISKFWREFCPPMAKWRGLTKIWNGCCGVWSLRTRPLGVCNFHGLSTHITHYQCQLRAYLRLSVV